MNVALKIAKTYLFSRKSTNAINIITGIAVVGVTAGTAALIIVLSVFNGFESLVLSLYNSFNPDIMVLPSEGKTLHLSDSVKSEILSLPEVEDLSCTIQENALLKLGDKQYIATIKGVDENYRKITDIDSSIIRGSFILKKNNRNYGVMGSGIELALNANINNDLNSIKVYLPNRNQQSAVNLYDAFVVKAIFPGGTYSVQKEFDDKFMFTSLDFARDLLQYDRTTYSSIEIKLKSSSDGFVRKLQKILGPEYKLNTRYETNAFLYKIMNTEKLAAYFILTFILVIASFNIIGALSMLVIEKSQDIGTLKVLGASNYMIRTIFLNHGLLMSFLGAMLGSFIAFVVCFAQQEFGLLRLNGLFVVDTFPVQMKVLDFILINGTVLFIGFLASFLPSQKASVRRLFVKGNES